MFYKSVLEQMYSVLLMNLYIYRPIGGDESGQCLRTDSRPHGCASLHAVVMATKYANEESSSFIPSKK